MLAFFPGLRDPSSPVSTWNPAPWAGAAFSFPTSLDNVMTPETSARLHPQQKAARTSSSP